MAEKKYKVLCWGACGGPSGAAERIEALTSAGLPPAAARQFVLCGINYPPGMRAVEGDVVDDIPVPSLAWLLDGGHIEEVEGGNE